MRHVFLFPSTNLHIASAVVPIPIPIQSGYLNLPCIHTPHVLLQTHVRKISFPVSLSLSLLLPLAHSSTYSSLSQISYSLLTRTSPPPPSYTASLWLSSSILCRRLMTLACRWRSQAAVSAGVPGPSTGAEPELALEPVVV